MRAFLVWSHVKNIRQFLEKIPHLNEFKRFIEGVTPCYLVGGAVRDFLLGQSLSDFDFATPEDPTPYARAWAKELQAHWFWLDETRRQSRVLLTQDHEQITFDFAPFRAETLEQDLRERDFTLNALAVELSSSKLIDPLGGMADLEQRCLKVCSEQSFLDDPLRVLRAARFVALLDLVPVAGTSEAARDAVAQLAGTAGERIKSELFQLFETDRVPAGLDFLLSCEALPQIFGVPLREENIREAIAATKTFSNEFAAIVHASPIKDLLQQPVEAGFSRGALMRLAAFLRLYSSESSFQEISQRLTLSRAATNRLMSLVNLNLSASALPFSPLTTPRQQALWAATLGRDPIDCLLFGAAMSRPERVSDRVLRTLIESWQRFQINGRIAPLIDGDWIRRELLISDGLQIGRFLERLCEAELHGEVTTPEHAQKYLKNLHEKEH